MPTGHRTIWREKTAKENRTLDTARVYAGAEALITVVGAMGRIASGVYEIPPAVVLMAKRAAIECHDALERLRREVDK